MKRGGIVVFSVVLALTLAAALFVRATSTPRISSASAAVPIAVPGVPPLQIDLTGDAPVVTWSAQTQARFEPCGCVAGMHGGLLRRAGLIARIPEARRIAVELGGWSAGTAAHQVLRCDHYLRALPEAGVRIVGLGRSEVVLGADVLAQHLATAQQAGLAVVCANLDGVRVEAVRRLRSGDRDYHLTSIVPAESGAPNGRLAVRDPAEALTTLLGTLTAAAPKGAPPQLIVLADLDDAGLHALAAAVPGLTALIGGAVSQPSPQALTVGTVRIVYAGNHGKVVGTWQVGSDRCATELIRDTFPAVPAVQRHLSAYQTALVTARLSIDAPSGVHPAQGHAVPGSYASNASYAGNAACAACHTDADVRHAASRHARSLSSLDARGYLHDPDCLRCHVTGLGRPGGFTRSVPADSSLRTVSCEACHGPASAHAADPSQRTIPVTPSLCLTCHDAENSPSFDYAAYWEKIRHR